MRKTLKFSLLITGILSVSISLAVSLGMLNIFLTGEISTGEIQSDKKLLEAQFYKSTHFENHVLRNLFNDISQTVLNENVEEKEDRDRIVEQKDYIKKTTNKYVNVDFIVTNTDTTEVYSNTKYSNMEEFLQNNNGYLKIELNTKDFNGNYKINIDNKEYNNISSYVNSVENFDAYITIPKVLRENNNDFLYNESIMYKEKIDFISDADTVNRICFTVFIISIMLYKSIKVKMFGKDSLFLKIYNVFPLELISIFMIIYIMISMAIGSRIYSNYHKIYETMPAAIVFFAGFSIMYIVYKQFRYYDNNLGNLNTSWTLKTLKSIVKISKKNWSDIPLARKIITLASFIIVCSSMYYIFIYSTDFWQLGKTKLISIILVTAFSVGTLALYFIKKMEYLSYIMQGAKRIKEGEINYKLDLRDNDIFTSLADDINNIGQGLDNAIDKQLKSERMKSELITNVSHDLKTPLTSIINYIELIKKEEDIMPDHIKDYINVLDKKSTRLKALIEDLFEASKASSGNIDLNMEKIDIKQLLRQSIGEMDEKLSRASLDIKVNAPKDPVYILADGRRIYRVLENLLTNISKYSLSNTRVYIDLIKDNNSVILTMKNISSYELNFNPSEIVERFKRADESRNTEGSGLGLAISRDLVTLQGGLFNIEIDGDLFKAILKFELFKENNL